SAGFPACGFTGLSSPVDQERATGNSPKPAGSKACATNPPRFMVPMRATFGVEALHEPEDTWLDSEELTYFRFLVPMRDKKGVQATHEPERRPPARPGFGAYYPLRRAGGRRSDPVQGPGARQKGVEAIHES